MKLLKELTEIRGASGDESRVRDFVINYIEKNKTNWTVQPQLFYGEEFQDTLIVVFGKPTTAIFAHMDSIGFTEFATFLLIVSLSATILFLSSIIARSTCFKVPVLVRSCFQEAIHFFPETSKVTSE